MLGPARSPDHHCLLSNGKIGDAWNGLRLLLTFYDYTFVAVMHKFCSYKLWVSVMPNRMEAIYVLATISSAGSIAQAVW